MKQDEIIEMAKQAGLINQYGGRETALTELIEDFAKLVEERCCSIIRDNIPRSGHETKEYVFAFKLIDAIKRGQA